MSKRGILVVSFGTTYLDTLKKTIEATENDIKSAFPEIEVRRAFTSSIVKKRLLSKYDIHVDNVREALNTMVKDGFTEVYVQPLHIIFGEEYDKICSEVQRFRDEKLFEKIEVSTPLLYTNDDYPLAVECLDDFLEGVDKETPIVLMAHGSYHPANACYMQFKVAANLGGYSNLHVATVEGFPLIEDIITEMEEVKHKTVIIAPFMLVCGDHANNDMASDEEDSFKSVLEKAGYKVKVLLKGMGESKAYRNMYVDKLKKCFKLS